jgi:hypothetical protein
MALASVSSRSVLAGALYKIAPLIVTSEHILDIANDRSGRSKDAHQVRSISPRKPKKTANTSAGSGQGASRIGIRRLILPPTHRVYIAQHAASGWRIRQEPCHRPGTGADEAKWVRQSAQKALALVQKLSLS